MDTQDTIQHAFVCLTIAYPAAPLGQINYAVSTLWNPHDTDEDNINSCNYLNNF